ncbi:ornithine carbamoyltransferase [Oceanithermus desulfurans]|uniref:Ornithine carbamoyltransferase n=2 Tax=Oceanithermus desulfurans TaxID=227924 RepID=A0A511RGP9_9DEIN|nr:ornithine carbamoyltransferase [Oceanithermus desulfurans]MBB6028760.1 ornithine carbamoyltransferase [Oceanithermus desulfurans]GEM88819.1 ornithine carbamoyltransferase [Oceanithermus desulfurans NBRC 100063]
MSNHLLSISDLDADRLHALLKTAEQFKNARYRGSELRGKTLAMIFEKPSLRTRTTLEVAAVHLGGHAVYLDARQVGLGVREPVRDVAENLGRWVEGVSARVNKHETVAGLAEFAGVPVINALSDAHHPLQALADLMTLKENFGRLAGVRLAYVGDGNNVLTSLLEAAALAGLEVVVSTPEGYEPDAGLLERAQARFVRDPYQAVQGVDAVYTDVWTSMGQEAEAEQRLRDFGGYTVTPELMEAAGAQAIFLHCLPAHYGEEVVEAVAHGPRSRIFDQAENRLHTVKAVLAHYLGGRPWSG